MDIFSATAAVLRRWYVALPVLLVTVFFAVQQYQSVGPTYTSSAASVLLPPPPRPATPLITDPEDLLTPLDPALASLGSGTGLVRGLVEQNLENVVVVERLRAQGATALYEVEDDDDAPLLEYLVTGDDPDVTARTLELLMAEASAVLTQVQQDLGATTPAVYRLQAAAPVPAPLEVAPERNRGLIATLVGGGALAYFLALLVDAGLSARRTHRERLALLAAGQPPADRRGSRRGDAAAGAGPAARTYIKRTPDREGDRQPIGDRVSETPGKVTSSATTRD